MRRRLVFAAFVLDGLCALAAPFVLSGFSPEARYVDVAGVCIEQVADMGERADSVAGRPVDDAFCQ